APLFEFQISGDAYSSPTDKFSNLLLWNKNNRLKFIDFRGRPVKSDTITYSSVANKHDNHFGAIVKSIYVDHKLDKEKTVFTIYATMKMDSSWIKDKNDSNTLSHEQGH